MTDVVPSSSTTDMLADESQRFAPSFCSRGHLPLVAAVDVMVLEDLRFPHGCMGCEPSGLPLPIGAWLAQYLSRSHPQTCTRSKTKARYRTLIQLIPLLDEYVGRPRGQDPSTRRAAASESRTNVQEQG